MTSLDFIIIAGTPPITKLLENDLVTTAPAAITQLSPIVTPSRIVTLAPIQQFFPIFIPSRLTPCNRIGASKALKT